MSVESCLFKKKTSSLRFTPGSPLVSHSTWIGQGKRRRNDWNYSQRSVKPRLEGANLVFRAPRLEISGHMLAYASGAQHKTNNNNNINNYILRLPSFHVEESAHERALFFSRERREIQPSNRADRSQPRGRQASTLSDLMAIRGVHGKLFRRLCLGTALGFRFKDSVMTDQPAIIVFVARKLNRQWVLEGQMLPQVVEGPGGVWCDIDVVEFSYHGTPSPTPKEQAYCEIVDCLRGSDDKIGPGSQVASLEVYGTLGALVRSRTGRKQVGFVTNRHVAVDLDHPYQKIFHPLPPNLGPGVYLGVVERATSFITDDLWYGTFAGSSPDTFVRADGAFIPFTSSFDSSCLTTSIKGVGEIGDVVHINLEAPVGSIVGKQVMKVGRSSGLTKGRVIAYAVEYHDEKGICFFTDLLVVGEHRKEFDMEGDSGSMILLCGEEDEKPKPLGMIWGGSSNRGRLKLRQGHEPENWTSGVDLRRLLELLQLDLIRCDQALHDALGEQHKREEEMETAQEPGSSGGEGKMAVTYHPSSSQQQQMGTGAPQASEDVSLQLSLSPPKQKRSRQE